MLSTLAMQQMNKAFIDLNTTIEAYKHGLSLNNLSLVVSDKIAF